MGRGYRRARREAGCAGGGRRSEIAVDAVAREGREAARRSSPPVRPPASARRRRSASMSVGDDVLRRANALSFGHAQLPKFRSRAGAVRRSRSAPIFSAPGTLRWRSRWTTARCVRATRKRAASWCRSSRGCRSPARTPTSGCPAKPGTEGVVALGLAHVIIANKLRPALSRSKAAAGEAARGAAAHRRLVRRVDGRTRPNASSR